MPPFTRDLAESQWLPVATIARRAGGQKGDHASNPRRLAQPSQQRHLCKLPELSAVSPAVNIFVSVGASEITLMVMPHGTCSLVCHIH